jgi:putative ABC transport system ATP-binding protein
MNKRELSQIKRDDLGLVFQSHYLFKGFSAYENLEVAAMLSNQDIEDKLLKKLSIDGVMTQKVTELSGGQQQRVSIARVLTKKPRIVFADEPTGNLDKENAYEVIDVLKEYCDENSAALITVTHDMDIAQKFDKVYELKDKKLVHINGDS